MSDIKHEWERKLEAEGLGELPDEKEIIFTPESDDMPLTETEQVRAGMEAARLQTVPPQNSVVQSALWAGQSYKLCSHNPTKVISGRGWSFWAADKEGARASLGKFEVVINCSGVSIQRERHVLPHELRGYETRTNKFEEILLDWNDMQDIGLKPEFWTALVKYVSERKAKALVHCFGGHGRTGTAVACLLIAACQYSPVQAIQWVRGQYCREAIETKLQETYIYTVGKALGTMPKAPKSKERMEKK